MAKRAIIPHQLYDSTEWHNATQRNHLFSAFADDPVTLMDTIQRITDVNLGYDFIRYVESHGTEYLPAGADGRYEWAIDHMTESNFECQGAWKDAAGTIAVVAGDKLGANRTSFYIDFHSEVFKYSEVIAGLNPFQDRLLVDRVEEVGNDLFRYQVRLAHSRTREDYMKGSAVLAGTRWSKEAALAPTYLSERGVDISHRTSTRAWAELSMFRVEHEIAGHMTNDYAPKFFYIKDENGKIINKPMWLTVVEYEFIKRIRMIRANLVMYGRSARWEDGSTLRDSRNKQNITAGSGFYEQLLSSNIHYFTGRPNLEFIENIILQASVGRISMTNGGRKALVKAGEYGLKELHAMVVAALGSDAYTSAKWLGDTTGRAFSWSGNNVKVVTGQIMGIALLNGVELTFMYDESKDMAGRNKVMMGNGLPGFAASYQYDIILQGADADSGLKLVRRQGDDPVFGVKLGMRGFQNSKGTSFTNARQVATFIDGSAISYLETGIGAKVSDPTKVIRYYPAILPV